MIHERAIAFAMLACCPSAGAAQQRSSAEAAPYAGGTIFATQVTTCRRVLAERRIAELAPLLCRKGGEPGRPCPAADRYKLPERAASKRRH
jgi:hypothetical protein